jgi:hypothetical protein
MRLCENLCVIWYVVYGYMSMWYNGMWYMVCVVWNNEYSARIIGCSIIVMWYVVCGSMY